MRAAAGLRREGLLQPRHLRKEEVLIPGLKSLGALQFFFSGPVGLTLPTSSSMVLLGGTAALMRLLPAGGPGHTAYAVTSAQSALSSSSCLSLNPVSSSRSSLALPAGRLP